MFCKSSAVSISIIFGVTDQTKQKKNHSFTFVCRFYDGICQWEEGSQTPILHIGWAKPLVTTIARFDCDIRSQVIINVARDDEDVTKYTEGESNNNIAIDSVVAAAAAATEKLSSSKEAVIPTLEALTAACGEKILNPDFLLQGGGQPFAEQQTEHTTTATNDDNDDKERVTPKVGGGDAKPQLSKDAVSGLNETKAKKMATGDPMKMEITGPVYEPNDNIILPKRPQITLYSRKMKGIRDLLLAEKLNTHAISLQVTAQSQVQVGGKKGRSSLTGSINYAKRSRRQ